jgi:hypothetical protein
MTDNTFLRPCEEDTPMPDWEWQAQEAAEAHLSACREALYHQDEHAVDVVCDDCPPDLSSAPFCDCDRCCVREVLYAAWPILAEMAVAQYLSLPPGGAPPWRRS